MRRWFLLLLLLPSWAHAVATATYTVTGMGGGGSCTAGSTTDANCTLDAAITTSADGDTILFAPSVQTRTIVVGTGFPDYLPHGLTIDGSPAGVIIDGAAIYTLFHVQNGLTVVLSHLTLQNGLGSNSGGAIFNDGDLTIDACTLSNNAATYGGAILNNVGATLTISNSTIAGNSASFGGGIDNGGTLTIANSTVAANTAVGTGGGGIANWGSLTLMSTIVATNVSANGADIYESGAPVSLGFNVLGDGTDAGVNDLTGNPLFVAAGLAANGGATWTLALQSTSLARGSGSCSGHASNPVIPAVSVDQRGVARGSMCTTGAFDMTPVFYAGFDN